MKSKVLILVLICVPFLVIAQKDTSTNVNRLLKLSLEDLMNIQVVTASGYLQTTDEAPSTITVISAKQIAKRGYEQLEDALRDIPGIDMIHVNGYAPTLFYFRGMYGAENLRALLMVDGIPENNIIGSNDMAGPVYSLHNAERVEIIWGPASALYGANAFGGVINIITKKGADINGFKFEKGLGTFNTSFQKISMGIKKGNWDLSLAGTLYSTDGPVFKNRDPNYAASYVDKAFSLNAAISYQAKRSLTTLGFRSYNTPMGWGTFLNSPTVFLGLPPQGNMNQGVIGLVTRDIRGEKSGLNNSYLRTFYLQNEFKPNDKFNLLSRVVYRETGTSDDSYAYLTLSGNKLIRAILANSSNRVSGEFIANYSINNKQKFSAGIQYFRDDVERGDRKATIDTVNDIYLIDGRDTLTNLNSTFLPRVSDIRNNFGSYLQYVHQTNLFKSTSFTIGARYDYNSYFGSAISPRISVVNKPTDKLTLKFQYGRAFRAPTNTEIYQAPPNFTLETEKIRTYEVNVIYALSGSMRMQLNGFRNSLTDVIVLGNLSGLEPDKNPAEQKTTGLEAVVDFSPLANTTCFVNLTYQDARGKNLLTGLSRQSSGVARIKGNAGITVTVGELFDITLIGNWIGKRNVPRTDPYGPVDGYFLANCVLSTKELFNKGITASINVRNIFNSTWHDPGFRTADGYLYSTVLEQPGINGMFKIGIRF
ncbi:TonB-dependent siderophore receptor [Ferruginibacter sp. HRS2-29]|uniref:TonB-dependent receptor plug domain-containing protein n=1 Tax=Ferruginibacter sp. HRS2-29 TaxID=2487334 RepID=UPI0020CD922E|nr:TonB-dependent receptor [Ferruginibacter sp. HRS2-29]MCP9750079.1 hypothetical protein [Ferruginibacter sp. HRS2-29]